MTLARRAANSSGGNTSGPVNTGCAVGAAESTSSPRTPKPSSRLIADPSVGSGFSRTVRILYFVRGRLARTERPDMVSDLRQAIRLLFRQRAFTLAACATLALGIGANTA